MLSQTVIIETLESTYDKNVDASDTNQYILYFLLNTLLKCSASFGSYAHSNKICIYLDDFVFVLKLLSGYFFLKPFSRMNFPTKTTFRIVPQAKEETNIESSELIS